MSYLIRINLLSLILMISCNNKSKIDINQLGNKNWYMCPTSTQDEDQLYDYIKGGILKAKINDDSISHVGFLNYNTKLIIEDVNENNYDNYYIPNLNKSEIISLSEDTLILVMKTPLAIYLYGSVIPISIDTIRFTSNFRNAAFELTNNYMPKFEIITFDYHFPKMKIEIFPNGEFILTKKGERYSRKLNEPQLNKLKEKILIACYISNIDRIFYQTHFRSFEDCSSSDIVINIKLKKNLSGFEMYDNALSHVKMKNNEISLKVNENGLDYNLIELSEYLKELAEMTEL